MWVRACMCVWASTTLSSSFICVSSTAGAWLWEGWSLVVGEGGGGKERGQPLPPVWDRSVFPSEGHQLLTPLTLSPPPPIPFLNFSAEAHCSHCLLLCPTRALICLRVRARRARLLTVPATVYSGGPLRRGASSPQTPPNVCLCVCVSICWLEGRKKGGVAVWTHFASRLYCDGCLTPPIKSRQCKPGGGLFGAKVGNRGENDPNWGGNALDP